jgi:hypothetical protein
MPNTRDSFRVEAGAIILLAFPYTRPRSDSERVPPPATFVLGCTPPGPSATAGNERITKQILAHLTADLCTWRRRRSRGERRPCHEWSAAGPSWPMPRHPAAPLPPAAWASGGAAGTPPRALHERARLRRRGPPSSVAYGTDSGVARACRHHGRELASQNQAMLGKGNRRLKDRS